MVTGSNNTNRVLTVADPPSTLGDPIPRLEMQGKHCRPGLWASSPGDGVPAVAEVWPIVTRLFAMMRVDSILFDSLLDSKESHGLAAVVKQLR